MPISSTGAAAATLPTRITSDDQTSNYNYVVLTADGSANTYGTYVACITATTNATQAITVIVNVASQDGGTYNVDIATGAGGSEVVLWSFAFRGASAASFGRYVVLPIRIAAGTRIAARTKCSTGSATLQICVSAAED